jgi:murein endopeptidase
VARRTRPSLLVLLLALIAAPAPAAARTDTARVATLDPAATQIAWRESTASGLWWAGRLRRGVQLPAESYDWFTWDPVLKRSPNRDWRRWGTDRLVRTVVDVLTEYRLANPFAPRVGIGDLSRPQGGDFGARFGGLGHASHQNGLDVDVYYPRVDRTLRPPGAVADVDRGLAQDLVSRFVGAGAQRAFVGLTVGLGGPPGVVQAIAHHDDHVHVRIANWRR